jgi:D-alanine-D-alanine ligase
MPLKVPRCNLPVLVLFNIDPSWSDDERTEVTSETARLANGLAEQGHETTLVPVDHADLPSILGRFDPASSIIFNWCESLPGVFHSEPMIPECLEGLQFTYTGAAAAALTLSQDKKRVREVLAAAGLPVASGRIFETAASDGWDCWPAIVKPANEHCSSGITNESVVSCTADLEARIGYIIETFKQPALVEEFIDGREYHVPMWGNGDQIEMLPPAEMDYSKFEHAKDRLCTYEAKFIPGSVHYTGIETLLPAPLTPAEHAELERVCIIAYRAIGCRDYGRIDVRSRNGVFYILDVNPNADISFDASIACAGEAAGYTYGELCSTIVGLAAQRHKRNSLYRL